MKIAKKTGLLALAFLLMLPSLFAGVPVAKAADGTIYYVSAEGDDTNGGTTEAAPYKTLDQAIASVQTGDTIVLLSDITLNSLLSINIGSKSVEIRSKQGERFSIIREASYANVLINVASGTVALRDLKIDGAEVVSKGSALEVNSGGDVSLQNVEVSRHHFNSGGPGSILLAASGKITIQEGTSIANNSISGRREDNPPAVLGAGTRGVLNVQGGEITRNTVNADSNGVIVGIGLYQSPRFEMTGGRIFANTLKGKEKADNGSEETVGNVAVYMRGTAAEARFDFGGTAYVYDNLNTAGEQRNVFLKNAAPRDNAYLTLIRALEPGAKIGVYARIMPDTKDNKVVDVAKGYGSYVATEQDAEHFFSDINTTAAVSFEASSNKVILDYRAPVDVQVTEPTSGSTVGTKPKASGTVTPGAKVTVEMVSKTDPTIKVQGEAIVDGSGKWTFTPVTRLAEGDYTLRVTAEKDGVTAAPVTMDLTVQGVDKTALQNKKDAIDVESLSSSDYQTDSWNTLQTKLSNAQTVLGDEDATQAEVDRALSELTNARQALVPKTVKFDQASLEKGASASRIVVTLDRGVTFDGQTPAGFSVRVGDLDVPAEQLNISVDPNDKTKVIVKLPENLNLSETDVVGIKYDQAVGNLKGLNGGSVSSFDKTAQSGLDASLQITKPDATSGIVPGDKPAFGGKVDPAVDLVTLELLDDQGQIIPGSAGVPAIDRTTGEWMFVSPSPLPPGTYTLSVTAKKGEEVSIKKRTFTVVDKSALKAREQAVTAENLNGASYTSSTWNELQTALTEARRVLDDPAASQAQIDAALNRLNTARTGLTTIPSNPGSGSPSPSIPPVTSAPQPNGPTKQIITVDVASGAEDLRDITKVELERTTATDGTLSDQVTFAPAKAQEAIDKALAKNDPTARILIPDSTDAVSRVNVDIPSETVELLKRNKIDLEIHNPNGLVVVPASSLEGREGSFYFRLVPVKNPQERQSVEQRAQTEQVVRQLSGSETAQVVSRPMTIETNLSSRPVTLVLPLDGTKLPTNEQERAAFLKNLGVYIEHSDGTKEVVRGAVETIDSPAISGNKLGLRFGIAKFSTFTIVSLNANEGMHEAYIQGYTDGTLRPDNAVIRSEMAAMLARLGQRSGSGTANFPDLPQRFWARDLIGQVTEAGWMKGYVDGTFKPNGEITREEMASIVFNYLHLSQGDATGLFPDVRAGSWSGGIIAAVQAQGIMTGDNGKFYPTRPLTRAEAVTILNRLFERGPLHGAPVPAWPDLNAGHWAYGDLLEAATTHGYADRSDGGEEWISAR
ncbi:S-layer homology domain-containing protein [Saccharibacillus sp. O23]|uniref:S-layer homology domain-containing protein n=1 Tax=Saccharibacillus sp. O23 TaxID=2009338 RepID=UPI0015C5B441|nr:S-layer homology domain-containing protein [Saccharibacillus sp. O23]